MTNLIMNVLRKQSKQINESLVEGDKVIYKNGEPMVKKPAIVFITKLWFYIMIGYYLLKPLFK